MQMQDLSYVLNNQKIGVDSYQVSVEVFSLENIYTVRDGSYVIKSNEYVSNDIVWGNDVHEDGSVSLKIEDLNEVKRFYISASLSREIRGVKLRFDDLPLGKLISLIDEDKEVTEKGALYRYPEAWRTFPTPLAVFKLEDGRYLYIRVLDDKVREKRFFVKKVNDKMRVDVVVDELGIQIDNKFTLPVIECGYTDDLDALYQNQSDYIKKTFELEEYKNSSIVPNWLNDISLVVTMHMQTFTGYIFHTYEQAYKDIEVLCNYIEPKRILVYLAGWEGRYYYKYGNYTADERMGGEQALKEMVQKMKSLGVKVMAMYGINIANRTLPIIRDFVEEAECMNVSGARFHHGSVNWEGAHHYDFNELYQFNVGNKKWQDYLFNQIKDATDKYDFDAAFLDIAAYYNNDKRYYIYDGVVQLCNRLRTIKKDFLVSGEAYYDALSKAMPLFQGGHSDGLLHYHDRVSPLLFTRFAKEFAHLCLGDMSRGSSGVHELGTNTDVMTPLREGIIPTLSLVEDTLTKSLNDVLKVIEQAKQYQELYLDKE